MGEEREGGGGDFLFPIRLANPFGNANFPPNISPSKKAFEKYKLRGLFYEFYGPFEGITKQRDDTSGQKIRQSYAFISLDLCAGAFSFRCLASAFHSLRMQIMKRHL